MNPTRPAVAHIEPPKLSLSVRDLAIVLLGPLCIALLALHTKSLWGDEVLSIRFAGQDLPGLLRAVAADYHPPLYFIILKGWMTLFGDGELSVRLVQAALGAFFLWSSLLLFRALLPDRALHPFFLIFCCSGELWLFLPMVRYYAFAAALAALCTVIFFYWMQRPRLRNGVWLFLSYLALLYTDYPSSVLLLVHLFYLIVKHRRQVLPHLAVLIPVGAAFVPWCAVTLAQIKALAASGRAADLNRSWTALPIKWAYSAYAFVIGETTYPFEIAGIVFLAALGGFVVWIVVKKVLPKGDRAFFTLLVIGCGILFTSLLTTFVSTQTSFIYTPARTFFVLPFIFIFAGMVFDRIPSSSAKLLLMTTLFVVQLYSLVNWSANRHFLMPVYATPWKPLMQDLRDRPGIALADERLCYDYYRQHLEGTYPQPVDAITMAALQDSVRIRYRDNEPARLFVITLGRESTESALNASLLKAIAARGGAPDVKKYLPIDESYRQFKSRILHRDPYDAKVTLYSYNIEPFR